MGEDKLGQFLRQADAVSATPAIRPDLAEHVIRRGRRRAATRRAATTAALIALASPLLWQRRPAPPAPVAAVPSITPAADRQETIAEATAQAIVRDRARQSPPGDLGINPQVLANVQLDEAAGFLVRAGDEMAGNPAEIGLAADDYRQVIRHFPQSRWADEARNRLRELRS
jgi:hypothetical protein